MGSSMGGLASFLIVWNHPEVFSMAGCMSSSFYYNDDKVFKILDEYTGPKKHIKFYIDHGEDGLVRGQKMFCKLTQMGYVIGTDLDYFYAPKAEHNETEWAKRLERPLIFFFGNK
jgi:predicted alpha/beta superfamily hydrolase